ncbi:MAG: hypothetical protein LQ351_004101 [Letrouitia transgressa]|nr:MAG: hypothetical protein LQ351_004101 [Letrouitia transgressa]
MAHAITKEQWQEWNIPEPLKPDDFEEDDPSRRRLVLDTNGWTHLFVGGMYFDVIELAGISLPAPPSNVLFRDTQRSSVHHDIGLMQLIVFKGMVGFLRERFKIEEMFFQGRDLNREDDEFLWMQNYDTTRYPEAENRATEETFLFEPSFFEPNILGNELSQEQGNAVVEDIPTRDEFLIKPFVMACNSKEIDVGKEATSYVYWKKD